MKLRYSDGYKYVTRDTVSIQTNIFPSETLRIDNLVILQKNGLLIIFRGYAWNGVSGIPDFKFALLASLFHDALYQLIAEGKLALAWRDECDRVLQKVVTENSNALFGKLFYEAVKRLGESYAKKLPPILEA